MSGPFGAAAVTDSMVYGTQSQARVVDVKDPLEQGRVRIRLAGQDAISKDDLPWIKPMGSQFSGVGGHGESTHQYIVGQYVHAALDQFNQIMHIAGTVNSPAQGGGDGSGGQDDRSVGQPQPAREKTTTQQHLAPANKSFIKEATGDLTMGDGVFSGTGIEVAFDEVTHIEQTLKKNNGAAKHDQKPTSAPQVQQLFEAIKHIKQWDPQNMAGAIKPALDAMDNLLKGGGAGGGDPFQSMQDMMGAAFGAFAAASAAAGQQAQQQANNIGSACLLENLITGETANGTIQMIGGIQMCVPVIVTANTPNMSWVPQFIPPVTTVTS